jgi:preprotein translocase subunit SecE
MNKIINYIKDSVQEMKKVTWPTKKEIRVYTAAIIGLSLALALYFGALDFVFSKLFDWIILK